MSIVTRNRISDIISRFSTGTYYNRVEEWFYPLQFNLKQVGVTIMSECPQFPQNEGDGRLIINNGKEEMYIYFTFYKMESGRWEIINYLT